MNTLDYTYKATVIRWVDGDTAWLDVDLGFRIRSTTDFRLYGINTPERGQAGYAEATARANTLAPTGSSVTIQVFKDPDKYGRWLVLVIPASGIPVNETLVQEGLAVTYFGRKV